jgi:hypothetical protein
MVKQPEQSVHSFSHVRVKKTNNSIQSSSRGKDSFEHSKLLSKIRKEFGDKINPSYRSNNMNSTKNRRTIRAKFISVRKQKEFATFAQQDSGRDLEDVQSSTRDYSGSKRNHSKVPT